MVQGLRRTKEKGESINKIKDKSYFKEKGERQREKDLASPPFADM